MQDTIELKLPISGKTVTIRNYTTRNDDSKANEAMYRGVNAEGEAGSSKSNIAFPLANIMESKDIYVRRLVQDIDGNNQNIVEQLGDLRSGDYEAIVDKVDEIVDQNSPKAKEAKKASKEATNEK
jgi:hypothetical protein